MYRVLKRVNLRALPTTRSDVIEVLRAKTPVVHEKEDGDWILVRTPSGRLGWVQPIGAARRMPLGEILRITMLGLDERVSAQRAYEVGLVNQVVPLAELDQAVDSWVEDILRCAPLSVRATKECSMKGLDESLPDAFSADYEWEKKRRASEDAREGPRAFAEKREPNWEGR